MSATSLIRYTVAFVMLFYAFAKINGSQFTILNSELDKPMGQVSGFWLTWYYFGYSPVYGAFLAVIQVAGAFLLTFRRTALLGACLLVPILANIVMIDLCYGIDAGAQVIALLLLAGVLYLIYGRRAEMLALFWPPRHPEKHPRAIVWWAVRAAMIGFTFLSTYWVANYNNRSPTAIDGAWDVVSAEPNATAEQVPRKIYFERNRAYMAVFQTHAGEYETHHFEVNESTGKLGIWAQWLAKGDLIFLGNFKRRGSELTLAGNFEGRNSSTLRLRQAK